MRGQRLRLRQAGRIPKGIMKTPVVITVFAELPDFVQDDGPGQHRKSQQSVQSPFDY
jgi:hypothetical protein